MNCWRCGRKLSATPEQIGLEFPCSGCGALYTVPKELFTQQTFSAAAAIPFQQSTPPSYARTRPTFPMLTFSIVLSALSFIANIGCSSDAEAGVLFFAAGFAVLSQCSWLWFHQRLWSLVPPNRRTVSPAKAVWRMLIPFYNIYWVFKSCIPLQGALNRLLDERRINTIRASKGLAVGFSLLFVAVVVLDCVARLAGDGGDRVMVAVFIGGAKFIVWLLMVINQKQVARQILLQPVANAVDDAAFAQV